MGRWAAVWGIWCAMAGTGAWAAAEDRGRLDVWVQPLAELPDPAKKPAEPSSAAELVAARGEKESFFVVFERGAGRKDKLAARGGALQGQGGGIPAKWFSFYQVGFVDVAGAPVADVLLPLEAKLPVRGVSLEEPVHQAVLVELRIPRSARVGRYWGEVEVSLGARTARIPVSVKVLAAQLPTVSTLPVAFSFSGRDALLGNGASLQQDSQGLVRAYQVAALDSRVTLLDRTAAAPDFRVAAAEGTMALDFAGFDAEQGPLLDGVEALDGAQASAVTVRFPGGLNDMRRFKYALAFVEHLRDRGWDNRLVDLGAETERPAWPKEGSLRRIEPRPLAECINAAASPDELPVPWWSLPTSAGSLQPSLRLGASPTGVRAIGWLARAHRIPGVSYDGALAGFREVGLGRALGGEALFYPGFAAREGGGVLVVESVRLKLLRDGLEDYELLHRAATMGRAALAREWIAKVVPPPTRFARDPQRYDDAKQALGGLGVAARLRRSSTPRP